MLDGMIWDDSNLFDEEIVEDDEDFIGYHTSLTYDDLVASGQSTRPLEFPTPVVYDGVIGELTAADHRTGAQYDLKNVLRRRCDPDTAYLIKKKLTRSNYGWVKLGVVLKRVAPIMNNNDVEPTEDCDSAAGPVEWQSTGDFVAIKCSSWSKIQSMRGRHLVDPIKEISVLQLIGNNNDSTEHHVMGCLEVLQTDDYLYTVMPYCEGGDIYGKLDITGLQLVPDEDQARFYFRQILKSLVFLHRKGICHRNVCLENLHLDRQDNLVLIDSGLSLRVPYCDPSNLDGVTDVSEGSTRLLMRPQGQCGQLLYLSPEVLSQKNFDGHATDLWAASITLFIMLVGVAPFGMAQCSDKRFEKISKEGKLKEFLSSLDVSLSAEAVDLLQNLLWLDPRDRLTLADVMAHPWVMGERFPQPSPAEVVVDPVGTVLPRFDSLKLLVSSKEQQQANEMEAPESPKSTIVHVQQQQQQQEEQPPLPENKNRRKRSRSGARESLRGVLKFMRKYGAGGQQGSSRTLQSVKSLETEVTETSLTMH